MFSPTSATLLRTKSRGDEMHQLNEVASRGCPTVTVRSLSPGDEEGLREMFSRLSPKTIYERYHMPYPRVPEWLVSHSMEADARRSELLVAAAGGEIVGHAMYVRSDGGREAEIALVVEDRWQARGVGKLLLSGLAQRAQLRGVEVFTGEVLGENRRVLGLLGAVFAEVGYTMNDGLYHVRMPLRSLKPATKPLPTVRSAA
jgi:GNAT superfamily N-acetyltransferase